MLRLRYHSRINRFSIPEQPLCKRIFLSFLLSCLTSLCFLSFLNQAIAQDIRDLDSIEALLKKWEEVKKEGISSSDTKKLVEKLRELGGSDIDGTGLGELLDGISANADRVSKAKDAADRLEKTIKLVETLRDLKTGDDFDGRATLEALSDIIEFMSDLMADIPPPFGTIAGPMLKAYSEAINNSATHAEAIQAATKAKNQAIAIAGGKTTETSEPEDVDDSFEWNVYPYPYCPECELDWWMAGNAEARATALEGAYERVKKQANELLEQRKEIIDKLVREGYREATATRRADQQEVTFQGGTERLREVLDKLQPEIERLGEKADKADEHAWKMRQMLIDCLEKCLKDSRDKYGLNIPGYGTDQGMPVSYGSDYPVIAYDTTEYCTYSYTIPVPIGGPGVTPGGGQPTGVKPPEGGVSIPVSTDIPLGFEKDKPVGVVTPDDTTIGPPGEEEGIPIVSAPLEEDEFPRATTKQIPEEPEGEKPDVVVTVYIKQPLTSPAEESVAVTNAVVMLNFGSTPSLPGTAGAERDIDNGAADPPIMAETDAEGIAQLQVPVTALPGGVAPVQPVEITMALPEGKIVQIDPRKGSDPKDYLASDLVPFLVSAIEISESLFAVLQYPKTQSALVSQLIGESSNVIKVQINFCRVIQGRLDDPFFNSNGSWGQDYSDQWGIRRVGYTNDGDSAWSLLSEKSQPVTVAVIDTGIDWNHKDLSWDNIWTNKNELPDNNIDDDGNGYVDDVIGWDFMGNTNKPWDRDGHGTFVSGIIAATQNNGIGIAGINPNAKIMVLKAVNDFGHTRASYIAQALIYAVENGARVINLSVGGKNQTDLEQAAIDYAHSRGAVIVVAAGNEGVNIQDFGPAAHEDVITVSATDMDDKRASYANWGAGIEISAPGTDILGLRARRTDLMAGMGDYQVGSSFVGEDSRYLRTSGTSFAAPIVAGTASLLLSNNPSLTNQQVKRILLNSAEDIDVTGVDQHTGFGLLNARAALTADPDYYVYARISGVPVIQRDGRTFVQVRGTVDADRFGQAWIELGEGENPADWKRVATAIKATVMEGILGEIEADHFRGAPVWTIRLTTRHEDGSLRRFLFRLNVG